MSDHGLGAAGTTSAVTGTGAVIADSVGWLNANADGMGIVIGAVMAFLTASFYIASIYLRAKELRRRHDQAAYELEREVLQGLVAIEADDQIKEQVEKIIYKALKNVRK